GRISSLSLAPNGGRALAAFLTACQNLPGLRGLAADRSVLGDEEAQNRLAGWPGLARLTELSLRGTGISTAGVRALLESPYLDPGQGPVRLERLDLRQNRFFRHHDAIRLLADLARRLPPERTRLVREWLRPVQQRVRPKAFADLVRRRGPQGGEVLLE